VIFAPKYVFRVVFEGGFLGGARNFLGQSLNSTTVLFDVGQKQKFLSNGCLMQCTWFTEIGSVCLSTHDYSSEQTNFEVQKATFTECIKTIYIVW